MTKTLATNQCLQIPEIVRLIAAQLGCSEKSMALTCRAFLEPALDCLWHDIQTLKPIISCLPSDLLTVETVEDIQKLVLLRPLVSSDLRRYEDFYMHRIRSFDLEGEFTREGPIPDASLLQSLHLVTNCRPGALSPFIKNLNWASCTNNSDETFPFFSLFLGQHLTTLHVSICKDIPLHVTAVQSGFRLCSHFLKYLGINEFEEPDEGGGILSAEKYLSLGSWDCLETFTTTDTVSFDDIESLSALPSLATLDIHDLVHFPLNQAGSVVDRGFPRLRNLTIREGSALTDAIGLLQLLPPTLQTIGLTIECSVSIMGCSQLFDAIQFNSNLQHLSLGSNSAPYTGPGEGTELDVDSMVDISPLLRLKELETLEIGISLGIFLTPDNASRFFFPHLTSLHLSGNSASGFRTKWTPQIDHTHLLTIARGCPSLLSLQLEFDASRLTEFEPLNTGEVFPLTRFVTGFSPIDSATHTIAFFKSYFPSLKQLFTLYGDSKHTKKWDDVRKGIYGMV